MTVDQFFSGWQATKRIVVIALVVVMVQALAILALVVEVMDDDRIITMIPPFEQSGFELARSQTDQDVLEAWGWSLAMLLGNVTPDNAEFIRPRLQPLLSPEIYRDAVGVIEEQVRQIREDRVVLAFRPQRVRTVMTGDAGRVYVTGQSTVSSMAGGRPDVRARTYELELAIRDYRLLVTDLRSYAGTPRMSDDEDGPAGPSEGASG